MARVLTQPSSCRLEVHKGVVGLIDCQGNRHACNQRHHRIFTGMAMMQGPGGQWLIENGEYWWYNSFDEKDGVIITVPGATDANEVETCKANTPPPILPLTPEGAHKVATELIEYYKVDNQESPGGGFNRMEFCSICNKLRYFGNEYLTTEEVRDSHIVLLLSQYAQPIIWMMRSTEGLCKQH